jgi:hypothetical protein
MFVVFGVHDDLIDVEGLPVVEVSELDDGVVEAVFFVAVDAAGFGVFDGDWDLGSDLLER